MKFIVDEYEDKNKQFEAKKALRKQYIKLLKTIKNPSKNAWNPYTKSQYADLSSVLKVIKTAQDVTGLAFFQDVSSEDDRITCYSYFIGMDGEIVFEPLTMPVQKTDPQSYASVETYARRYSAQSCVGIVAEADDDGNQSSYKSHQSSNNYGSNNSHRRNNYYSNYQGSDRSSYKSSRGNSNSQQGNRPSGNQNSTQGYSSKINRGQVNTMRKLASKISDGSNYDDTSIGNQALSMAGVKDKTNITHDQANETIDILTKQLNNNTNN